MSDNMDEPLTDEEMEAAQAEFQSRLFAAMRNAGACEVELPTTKIDMDLRPDAITHPCPHGAQRGECSQCATAIAAMPPRSGVMAGTVKQPDGTDCGRCQSAATTKVTTRSFGVEDLCEPCAVNVRRDGQERQSTMTVHDLALIRRTLLEVIDDGPDNDGRFPWDLYGEECEEVRLTFCDEVQRKIVEAIK